LIPDSSSLVQDSFAETIGRIQEIETTEGFRFDKEEMKELVRRTKLCFSNAFRSAPTFKPISCRPRRERKEEASSRKKRN
jgi:hypothetical protein